MELATIGRAIDTVVGGQGGWLVISGQPGSGKTRLLEDAKGLALQSGARYFYGSGDPEGHLTPFAPLLVGMEAAGVELLAEDELASLESNPENRFWILQELQDGLDRASLDGPMVIVIDDLQWCDDATLLALKTLPLRLSASPILWVVAVRQSAMKASRITSVFERYGDIGENLLTLGSLSDSAVASMVHDVVGATPDARMLRSVLQSEGLPLYVLELLGGLVDEGLIASDGGVARLIGSAVPQRFRESVKSRVSALSARCRQTLEVASVIGRTFELEVLAEMLDVSVGDLIGPVREAVDAGLLLDIGDLRFSHDLFREIIEEEVPATAHRILRRKVIDVQLARGGNVIEVATMLAESAQPGDSDAVSVLRSAARQLSSLTPSTAADLAVRALELSPGRDPDRAEIVSEAATYLWQAGQATHARRLIDKELSGVASGEEEALLRLSVTRMSSQFSFSEAVKQATIALALPGISEATRQNLEAQLALNTLMTAEVQRPVDLTTAAPENLAVLATFATARASRQFYGGKWELAFASIHEAMIIADLAQTRYRTAANEAIFISFMYVSAGDISSALREADRGIQETTRLRQGGGLRLWIMTRARVLLDAGRLADAGVEAQALLEMVDELGPGNFADITAIYTLVRVALYEGDVEAINTHRVSAERMSRDEAARIRNTGSWLASLIAGWYGEWETAIELALPVLDRLGLPGPYFSGSTDAADDVVFVRMALRTGHRRAATTMVAFAEARAAENRPFPILRATAMHARALLSDDRGLMLKAVVLLESIDRPIVLASALEDLGRMNVGHDSTTAIDHFKTALKLYAEAGAFHEEKRITKRLANLGAPPETEVPSGTDAWSTLSTAQRAVASLIVQGLTNRQVAEQLKLSPHTVNAHLRFAFIKLGVHSRVELAGLYHQTVDPS
ncbi:helix-turn-helix transcriptional regulator [Subtercola boreus]|uniref:helix-turn-helix transcriptional regulator n=1 Tax=Subtercola boreus TaxID=120213 RepID=UPI0011699DD6|nr:LuxR family transcriptional regulator [Subtercola boreus]TQL56201.1 regulatory LuxR family protein [Subtercola boreus]